jgi:hypothetical protein
MTDTERMDWVEKVKPIIFMPSWDGDKWEICIDARDLSQTSCGDTFREAIDAAINCFEEK